MLRKVGYFIYGFMLLLLIGSVLAETMEGYVGQPTTVVTACIRNGQMRDGLNVTITIYNSTGGELVSAALSTALGNGTYGYTYTFEELGAYSTRETCDFGDYLADGSTQINIIKQQFGSMQVLAQGVAEVSINKTARSEWLFLLANATNASISTVVVNGGVCAVYNMTGDVLELAAVNATVVSNDRLQAVFVASSGYGFEEGENYELKCNVSISDGLIVNGVKNYVYINPHMTYLQYLASLISSMAELLGITESTQLTVNQTLDISNQTLILLTEINATGLASSADLLLPSVNVWYGNTAYIRSRLIADGAGVNDATCNLTMFYISSNDKIFDAIQVVANGTGGDYVYEWVANVSAGRYPIYEVCYGGGLGNKILQTDGEINVLSEVKAWTTQ